MNCKTVSIVTGVGLSVLGFGVIPVQAAGHLPTSTEVSYTVVNASNETLSGLLAVYTYDGDPEATGFQQTFDLAPAQTASGALLASSSPHGYLVGGRATIAGTTSPRLGAGCSLPVSAVEGNFPQGKLQLTFRDDLTAPADHRLKCTVSLQ